MQLFANEEMKAICFLFLKTAESKGELQTFLGQACITESQSQKKQVKQEVLDIKEASSFSSRDANRHDGQVKKKGQDKFRQKKKMTGNKAFFFRNRETENIFFKKIYLLPLVFCAS